MSSARRGKKGGLKLSVLVPIICVIVVAITFYLIRDMEEKIENNEVQNTVGGQENIVEDENVAQENTLQENQVEENVTQNEVSNEVENKVSNTTKNTAASNSTVQNSAPAQPAVTDKKQRAIELVKKEWGTDDSVSYVFEYINENGEYVIAVKDKASATVKYYFRVDLDTETVELD